MSSFWPKDIELTDTQSPREILKTAQEDWQTGSDGVMGLVLQDAKSESGNPIIIVRAKHTPSNRTATLFSVIHRPNNPYPATIQPEYEDLPDFLKKSYQKTTKSFFKTTSEIFGDMEENIANPWVSDTPSEFRKKLSDVLNLGSIKSIILNLASTSVEGNSTNGTSRNDIEEIS